MINPAVYRLGRYRIADYGGGQLVWEGHAALGEQQGGRCFVCGDVLIIGRCSHQENGYLIGEFLDLLEDLPAWDKTRYYCLASSLSDVDSRRNLSDDALAERLSLMNMEELNPGSGMGLQPGNFRLGRYRLTVAENRMVSWQTHEGPHKVMGGPCIVQSGLLLICAREYSTEGYSRQDFLTALELLPQWDRTIAWRQSEGLTPCRQGPVTGQIPSAAAPARGKPDPVFDSRPATADGYVIIKNIIAGLLASSLAWLKAAVRERRTGRDRTAHGEPAMEGSYPLKGRVAGLMSDFLSRLHALKRHLPAGRAWLKFLVALVAAGLLFGLTAAHQAARKGLPWGHWFKQHHHKHDDHDRR